MSTKKGPERDELQQDTLVEQLVDDPLEIPEVTMLTGFLGKSPQPEYYRLYLTPTLDQYYEIAERDILRSQPLDSERSPLGGTTVWVRRDATIKLTVTTKARQMQADFLKGALAAKYLPHTGVTGLTSPLPDPNVEVPTWLVCAISPIASAVIVLSTCIGFGCTPTPSCVK